MRPHAASLVGQHPGGLLIRMRDNHHQTSPRPQLYQALPKRRSPFIRSNSLHPHRRPHLLPLQVRRIVLPRGRYHLNLSRPPTRDATLHHSSPTRRRHYQQQCDHQTQPNQSPFPHNHSCSNLLEPAQNYKRKIPGRVGPTWRPLFEVVILTLSVVEWGRIPVFGCCLFSPNPPSPPSTLPS